VEEILWVFSTIHVLEDISGKKVRQRRVFSSGAFMRK
jgi:hypothetical protein